MRRYFLNDTWSQRELFVTLLRQCIYEIPATSSSRPLANVPLIFLDAIFTLHRYAADKKFSKLIRLSAYRHAIATGSVSAALKSGPFLDGRRRGPREVASDDHAASTAFGRISKRARPPRYFSASPQMPGIISITRDGAAFRQDVWRLSIRRVFGNRCTTHSTKYGPASVLRSTSGGINLQRWDIMMPAGKRTTDLIYTVLCATPFGNVAMVVVGLKRE